MTERKLPPANNVMIVSPIELPSGIDQPDFVCEDCEDNVYVFGDHDGFPVCATCRFIREHPDMPEHIKAVLRGDE